MMLMLCSFSFLLFSLPLAYWYVKHPWSYLNRHSNEMSRRTSSSSGISTGSAVAATKATSDATSLSIPTMQTILGEALEVCIHELLYQRDIYPREIFATTRDYLGIRCHVACHEELSSYIVNTLDVAVPALCSGLSDKLSFDVVEDKTNIVESYIFEVDSTLLASGLSNQEMYWDAQKVAKLERHFKNLVLKIITLEGSDYSQRTFSPNVGFKLRLHTKGIGSEDQHDECRELQHAIQTGAWRQSVNGSESDLQSHSKRRLNPYAGGRYVVTRSLKSVHVPECHLRMEFMLQFNETTR